MASPHDHPTPPPDLLSRPTIAVADLAVVLGIGESAAYKAVHAGDIPSFRIGGRILIPTAAVRRMLMIDETLLQDDGHDDAARSFESRLIDGGAQR